MSYNINLKHLECFIKVAQLGSINKAAQALFISQPHLGKIIHDLENEMGYLLLNRSNQGVTLTPEGEEFLKHAARVLEEMNCLRRPSIKNAEFNHLSVSMTKFSHVMESFIEVVLNHQDQPSFSHRLYEGNAEEVIVTSSSNLCLHADEIDGKPAFFCGHTVTEPSSRAQYPQTDFFHGFSLSSFAIGIASGIYYDKIFIF